DQHVADDHLALEPGVAVWHGRQRPCGQKAGDAVEADGAGHLLDKIGALLDVTAPGGDGDRQRLVALGAGVVALLHAEAKRAQALYDLATRPLHAGEPVDLAGVESDDAWLDRLGVEIHTARRDCATSQLGKELRSAINGDGGKLGVRPLLEAAGG